MKRSPKSATTLFLAVLAILLAAVPAWGHVTVQPSEAEVGSFSRFVVRVPNERDDASTIRIEVQLPPLAFVSFQPKEGWERTVEMRTLDEPLEVFGESLTEVVGTVTWEGGAIGPNEFEEFGFSARTPDEPGTLEFPAIQVYDSGEEVRWVGAEDADEPAARLTTVDLAGDQGQLATLADVQDRTAGPGTSELLALVAAIVALVLSGAALVLARRSPAAPGRRRPETDPRSNEPVAG